LLLTEAGARLRALRNRAGMTMDEVGHAMGIGQGQRRAYVWKLETGHFDEPLLHAVVDYLRAVRGRAADLRELFDRFTSLPIPEAEQEEARSLPALPGPKPRPALTRAEQAAARKERERLEREAERVRRTAGYWNVRGVLEYFLHSVLNDLGAPAGSWLRRRMAWSARRVFHVLFHTRGAKERFRDERLAALRKRSMDKVLTDDVAQYVTVLVRYFFDDLQANDELDWLPPLEQARALMARKAGKRTVTDLQMCVAEYQGAYARYVAAFESVRKQANEAGLKVLDAARLEQSARSRYLVAFGSAANVARTTEPGSEKRRRLMEERFGGAYYARQDPKLVRRVAQAVTDVWDARRGDLPPLPGPRIG
jgi:transcriptional regulator with XRE-family HTH domain